MPYPAFQSLSEMRDVVQVRIKYMYDIEQGTFEKECEMLGIKRD